MFRIGTTEIFLIAVIVILIFGPKKLPELGRGIGQFIKNLKNSFKDKND